MADRSVSTVLSGEPVLDWCRRCNLSRTTVQLWVLTEHGMHRLGHRVHCGCYH